MALDMTSVKAKVGEYVDTKVVVSVVVAAFVTGAVVWALKETKIKALGKVANAAK